MTSNDGIKKQSKLLKGLDAERELFLSLLESGNLQFLRFAPPGHFYSPIPDRNLIDQESERIFDASVEALPCIDLNEVVQLELVRSFHNYHKALPFTEQENDQRRYYYENPFFSYGDGVMLYSFIRHFSPRRIIEVGSGFSSALMLDTNELFLECPAQITFIEPYTERLQQLIKERDRSTVELIQAPVQDVDINLFSELEENDILFIDSSHVAKTGSDVLHILFSILPGLKDGVIIHFHDILWPFEYPKKWLKSGRAWNEAYFLRAFLQNNNLFKILCFNSYLAKHHMAELKKFLPMAIREPRSKMTPGNSSLWLKKLG